MGVALLLVMPPVIAHNKGHSFAGFLLGALLCWPVALIAAVVVRDTSVSVAEGSIIRTRARVRLQDGAHIPRGHRAQVRGLDIIDNTPVVNITGPDDQQHWIAKENTAVV